MYIKSLVCSSIVCMRVLTPPPTKAPSPFFLPSPPLHLKTVQAIPLFRQSSPLCWFFVNSPLKVRFFNEHPKYYIKFFHF